MSGYLVGWSRTYTACNENNATVIGLRAEYIGAVNFTGQLLIHTVCKRFCEEKKMKQNH